MSDTMKRERLQVEMHTDFFDKTNGAIEQGFYLEAIFREYAAVEGRLEVILGVLGSPCGKNVLTDVQRKDVQISHRLACVKKIYTNENIGGKTKIDKKFFDDLKKWIGERNRYVHGLYKGEMQYKERCENCKDLAINGERYARMLYNEAKRLRRYKSNNSECCSNFKICYSNSCKFSEESEEEKK